MVPKGQRFMEKELDRQKTITYNYAVELMSKRRKNNGRDRYFF